MTQNITSWVGRSSGGGDLGDREGPVGEHRQDAAPHDLLVADDLADVALAGDGVPDHRSLAGAGRAS